jgi:fatty acid desaturase
MSGGTPTPQINVSKIPGGAGVAGAMVAISSTLIFLIGIPRLWYFLPPAIVLGGGIALVMHFVRHETPGKPWILTAKKK